MNALVSIVNRELPILPEFACLPAEFGSTINRSLNAAHDLTSYLLAPFSLPVPPDIHPAWLPE